MIDAGVPDGIVASLVVRPLRQIKLHGGVGYNLVAPGVRFGASLAPVRWWLTPSLNVEAGRYFVGDANGLASMFESEESADGGDGGDGDNPILRELGYDYANIHLGIEIGSTRFSYYLQAGFSAIRGEIRNLDEALTNDDDDAMDGGRRVEVRENAIVELWMPSARMGFVLFF